MRNRIIIYLQNFYPITQFSDKFQTTNFMGLPPTFLSIPQGVVGGYSTEYKEASFLIHNNDKIGFASY